MAINKVVYGTTVLVDLTSDTVDAAHLAKGCTAHDAGGNLIVGTLEQQGSSNLLSGITPSLLNGTTQNGKAYVIPSGIASNTECIKYELDIPKLTSDVYYCLTAYSKTEAGHRYLTVKLYFEAYDGTSFRTSNFLYGSLGDVKSGSFKMTRGTTMTKLVFECGDGNPLSVSNISLTVLDV